MRHLTRWVAALAMIVAGLAGAAAAAPPAYATPYCSSYQSLCWHMSASPPSTMPSPVPGQDFAVNVGSYATGASAGAPPIPTSDFVTIYYGFGSSCTGSQLYNDWLSGGSPSASGCSKASSPGCTPGVSTCTAQIPVPAGETQPLNYEAWALDSAHGDVMEYCSNAGSITVGIAPQVTLASTFGSGRATVASGTPVELEATVSQGAVAPALYVCDQSTQRYESATPSTSISPFVGVSHVSGTYAYWALASDRGGLQGTVCANTQYPPAGWANQGLSNPISITWTAPTTAATATLTANGRSGAVDVPNGTQVNLVGNISNTEGATATYLCASFDGFFLGAIPVSSSGTSPVTMNATTVGHSNFIATFWAYSSAQQGENGSSGSQGNACPGSGVVAEASVTVDWQASSSSTTTTTTVPPTTTTTTTTTTTAQPVSLSLVPPDPQVAPQPAHLKAVAAGAPSGSTIEIVEAPSASAVAGGSPHAIATCHGSTCTTSYTPPKSFDQTGGVRYFRAILTNSSGRPHSATLAVTWGVVEPT